VTTVPTALPSGFSTLYRERWFTTAGESAPIESSRTPASTTIASTTSTSFATDAVDRALEGGDVLVAVGATAGVGVSI